MVAETKLASLRLSIRRRIQIQNEDHKKDIGRETDNKPIDAAEDTKGDHLPKPSHPTDSVELVSSFHR